MIPQNQLLSLSYTIGLHPAMTDLKICMIMVIYPLSKVSIILTKIVLIFTLQIYGKDTMILR